MRGLVHAHYDIGVEPADVFPQDQPDMEQLERLVRVHLVELRSCQHRAHFLVIFVVGLKVDHVASVAHLLRDLSCPGRRFGAHLVKEARSLRRDDLRLRLVLQRLLLGGASRT